MRGIFVAGEELHVDEAEVRRNFVAGDTHEEDGQTIHSKWREAIHSLIHL